MSKSIKQLTDEITALATEKGWGTRIDEVYVLEKFALIHSEVSEALDAYRNNRLEGKDSLKEELADIIFRVLHLANILNITDLDVEIENKIKTNYSRDWSHKNETHV